MNVALTMAFFAEVTSNGFERLRYSFILMDADDALCKNLWESNCYLRLLQSASWGNLLQFPYVTLGKSLTLSHLNEGKSNTRLYLHESVKINILDYTHSAATQQGSVQLPSKFTEGMQE